jgi:hypothetical protein
LQWNAWEGGGRCQCLGLIISPNNSILEEGSLKERDSLVCRRYMIWWTSVLLQDTLRNAFHISTHQAWRCMTYRKIDTAFWHSDCLTCLISRGCLFVSWANTSGVHVPVAVHADHPIPHLHLLPPPAVWRYTVDPLLQSTSYSVSSRQTSKSESLPSQPVHCRRPIRPS